MPNTGDRQRGGISLSVKLIATTSLLLSVAVVVIAWIGLRTLDSLAREGVEARRRLGEQAVRREAELLARNAASAAALPLAGGNFADLQQIVDSTVAQQPRVRWVLISDHQGADTAGKVVARTDQAPRVDQVRDELSAELARQAAAGTGASAVAARREQGSDAAPTWICATWVRLDDRTLGEVRLAVSTADLEAELAASLRQASDEARSLTRQILLTACIILFLGIGLAAFQGYRIARPLRALARQAERISGGDLYQRVRVQSRDEIGVLAANFNVMVDFLVAFLQEQANKASLEREMSLARSVQQSMIPTSDLIEHGGLKLTGYCVPASITGGDWWAYRKLSGGRLFVVVGDATGHGMDSAMIAGTARGVVEALAGLDERLLNPKQLLMAIHSAVCNSGDHSLLMTCLAAIIDPRSGVIHYANAGHKFPYIVHMGPNRVLARTTVLTTTGSALGERNQQPIVQLTSHPLQPGDVFVCFSDGLVDRARPGGKQFGDRRLHDALINRPVGTDPGALLRLRDQVLGEIDTFAAGEQPEDDVTFVICMYDPPDALANQREQVRS